MLLPHIAITYTINTSILYVTFTPFFLFSLNSLTLALPLLYHLSKRYIVLVLIVPISEGGYNYLTQGLLKNKNKSIELEDNQRQSLLHTKNYTIKLFTLIGYIKTQSLATFPFLFDDVCDTLGNNICWRLRMSCWDERLIVRWVGI